MLVSGVPAHSASGALAARATLGPKIAYAVPTVVVSLIPTHWSPTDIVIGGILAAVVVLTCIGGILLVVRAWPRTRRQTDDAPPPAPPLTRAELITEVAPKNRLLALTVLGVVLAMFVSVFFIGVLYHVETQGSGTVAAATSIR